jgi:hypothetical protein
MCAIILNLLRLSVGCESVAQVAEETEEADSATPLRVPCSLLRVDAVMVVISN